MSSIAHYDDTNAVMVSRAETLAARHWAFIGDLLTIHGIPDERIVEIEFHYTSAFVHGYKHGIIDANRSNQNEQDTQD